MITSLRFCALALFAGAVAQAAATSTTITVTNATYNAANGSVSGPVTLTNFGTGTFTSTVTVGANITGNYTIALSGGNITGVITLPATVLSGSGSGSMTVTGGTGSYAGATGSFPTISGSGTINTSTFAITLSFSGSGTITTGGSTGGGTGTGSTPAITAVQDAASYTSSIAEGSIFVVKGSNLSPTGLGSGGLLSFGFPLPASSNGVSISFTPAAGGTATNAYLIYLYNSGGTNQLAAILPSTVAPGNYNVTVTSAGATSAPFAVAVVKSKPAMFTLNQAGDGLAIVQNYVSASESDYNLYVTESGKSVSPAYPGQTLIAWATGLGPITSGDNTAAPVLNVASSSNVQVIVGGMTITPSFAGRAPGLAGEDQIDFVLPANVPTGCAVSFQISANGVTSPATYISIAPNASAGACVQPGITTSQLQSIEDAFLTGSSLPTFSLGAFTLENYSITETIPSLGTQTGTFGFVGGEFVRYTGFQLNGYSSYTSYFTASNSCQLIPLNTTTTSSSSGTTSTVPTGTATALDAGAITLTGPSGSNINNLALTETMNAYSAIISEQFGGVTIPGMQNNGTVIGGLYTLKGAGGKDVGPFTAQVNLSTVLTTSLPSTVTRGSGLTLTWSGGSSSDLVYIEGLAATTTTSTSTSGTTVTENGAEFICITTAGAGSFTVPGSITGQLPAVNPATTGAVSSLSIFSVTNPTASSSQFTAPLTAGGSINAYFLGYVGASNTPIWQ